MHTITEIKFRDGYNVLLTFENGVSKTADLKPFISNGISAPLKDPDYFKLGSIEPGGGITWPNGYDFCPNYLWKISI